MRDDQKHFSNHDDRSGIDNRQSSLINRHSHTPLLAVTVSFLIGIIASLFCRNYCFAAIAFSDSILIYASFAALRRERIVLSLLLGLSAVSAGGLLTALAQRDGFPDSDLRFLLARNFFPLEQPVSFEGCVAEESEEFEHELIATIDLRAFLREGRWQPCKGKAILRISETSSKDNKEQDTPIKWGDRVRGWSNWHTPRNYQNPGSADRAGMLTHRGIFLIGRTKSPRLLEVIPGDCAKPWTRMAMYLRSGVRRSLEPVEQGENKQAAAILASLVIGNYSNLDNQTREVFQNSGTFHVLVVSGLHVAWIAGVLLGILRLSHCPAWLSRLLAALAILIYAYVVGFQASITRCLWMFILYLLGQALLRRAKPVNILLASALILLAAHPDWMLDIGFQLSFLSVLAIVMTAVPIIEKSLYPLLEPLHYAGKSDRVFLQTGRWFRRGRSVRTNCELLIEAWTDSITVISPQTLLRAARLIARIGLVIGSAVAVTMSVQIWIEPLLACRFNRLSWISPLANLVIVPFSSIVLASGIISAFFFSVPYCGPASSRLAEQLASLLLHCASRISDIAGAWQRCPTPSIGWILAGILLLFLWRFFEWRRSWISYIYIAVFLAILSFGSRRLADLPDFFGKHVAFTNEDAWSKDSPVLSFTFLDVGEGDSIVIDFPDKSTWVIDAGGIRQPSFQKDGVYVFDVGEAVVSRYLWSLWTTKIDRLLLSHTDQDHAGGVQALMKNFRIRRFDYSDAGSDAILTGIINLAGKKGLALCPVSSGRTERIGEVMVETLHPPKSDRFQSPNDKSLVLHFIFKRFSALMTGDLEKSGEADLLSRSKRLGSLLLKVAHHGSRFGTSDALLDSVHPRWAVISVGRSNPFGHPSQEVLLRLRRRNTRSILTQDEGAVSFQTDGIRYVVSSYVSGVLEKGILPDLELNPTIY
jgi:competence protein ComEC